MDKSPSIRSPLGISLLSIIAVVAVLSFVIYYLTAFRTITWWDSGEYSLAAATLGVAHPPGCLLGTILGWVVTKLAVCGSIAFSLNLFAGLTAALTAVIVGLVAGYYLRKDESSIVLPMGSRKLFAITAGAIIGALTLAFTQTFWLYATRFTPYILTVLFTALLLWAMIKVAMASERDTKGPITAKTVRWLFIVTLLFGLDFSVHRTNLLMAPGLIVWLLIFNPRIYLSWRIWLYGAGGLASGLALHLLIIPMAAVQPFLNAGAPDSLSGFWDYVTLKQLGGGFLVKFFPRNAPFWDVQVMDYLRAFSVNFFSWGEPVPVVGLLPGILGVAGLIGIWRKNRQMAIGMLVLFLLTSLGAILYFNIPANFFRSLFRHYMPSFVIFAVWMAYGVGSLMVLCMKLRHRNNWLVYVITAVLILALPGYQVAKNYHRLDASNNYFAADYALNMLNTLPEDAILITFGDNDTFPLWYFQVAEGIRPDVTILNSSLLNTSWFVRQALIREPDLPLGIAPDEVDNLRVQTWQDTVIAIPVIGTATDFGLADDIELPDSMYLHVPPTVNDQFILISDQLLLGLIQNSNWRRPIYFSAAGGVSWLTSYTVPEGLVQRLTPIKGPPVNRDLLATNLVEKYSLRGYADEEVYIDPATKMMSPNLYKCFLMDAQAAYSSGDQEQFDRILTRMMELLPPERLRPLPEYMENIIQQMLELRSE